MGASVPRSLLTTQPKAGRRTGPMVPEAAACRPVSSSVGSWLPCVRRPRRMAKRSARRAWSGINSQTSRPGTLVRMGWNSPAVLGRGVRLEVVHVDVAGAARQVDHDDRLVGVPRVDGALGPQAEQVGQGQTADAEGADAE